MIYDIDSQEATMNLVISEEITDNFNYSSSANADFVPDIQNYALTNNLEDIFVLDQLFPSLNNVVNSVNNTLIEDASGYAWFGHHSHITTNNADQDSRYYASEISGVSNLTDNPLNLSEMNLWEEAYSKAFDRLNSFVNNSNVEEQLKSVFGEQVDIEAAQNLINQIILGEIVPTIEIVSSADIGGAQGAYAKDTNTIYISQEVFSLNDVRFVTDVLTEEIGHYLDDYLGNEESLGDTGLAFAMQVRSQNLDVESLEFARSINDNITVDINGELTNLQTSSLQDRWYINIYEWENRTLDNLRYATQAVAGKTVSNVRSDGNIGFSENWGWGSPDVGNGNYLKPFIDLGDGFIGNIASDYFSKNMWTQYEFQAGEQYEFTVRSDDGFRIAARPIDSENDNDLRFVAIPFETENWEFITRNDWEWETAYDTRTYTFTPQQSGDYWIYVEYYEEEEVAYFDLTWNPVLADDTNGQSTDHTNNEPINLRDNWRINIYDWSNNDFITVVEDKTVSNIRSDGNIGFSENWGWGSPDVGNGRYVGNDLNQTVPSDYFLKDMWTHYEFQAGEQYEFTVRSDDGFKIVARPIDSENWEFITRNDWEWETAYDTRTYTFTPQQNGEYVIYVEYSEIQEVAYFDLTWNPVLTDDTNGQSTDHTNNEPINLRDNWRINIYDWSNDDSITVVEDKTVSNIRSDGNIGFSENWGWDSPDVGNGRYVGNDLNQTVPSDYFLKDMLTQYEFQAGQQYEFTVRSDDGFRIAARPIDSENWEFITRNDWEWETAYDTRKYTFTPQQSGDYWIWVDYYEIEEVAYFDLTWNPVLADDTNGQSTDHTNNEPINLRDNWRINIYDWSNDDSITVVEDKTVSNIRSDGNIGFSENWGLGSPDVGNGRYVGNDLNQTVPSDYFRKNMLTQYEFQAGEQYEFTVRSDDDFRIAASPIDSENWEFITRNDWEWETAYNTKTYTFTPQQSGDYSIYVQYREKERNAYFDLTWQPKLSDTTRSFEFADWIHSGTPPAFREFSGNSGASQLGD